MESSQNYHKYENPRFNKEVRSSSPTTGVNINFVSLLAKPSDENMENMTFSPWNNLGIELQAGP